MASLPVFLVITFFSSGSFSPTTSVLNSEMVADLRLDSFSDSQHDGAISNLTTEQLAIAATKSPASTQRRTLGMRFPNAPQWIVSLYLLGVVCFLARLLTGVWGGSRLRSRAKVIRDARLRQQIAEQAKRMRLRGVPAVAYCQCVAVPTVVGLLRPMILLPTSLMTGLTPDDLNAILRHEFAHIRRFDLWVNLGQRIVESVLFFHPAVWWLSRRISSERELCCDEAVVSSGLLSIDYAGALLRMAERCAGASRMSAMELAADGQNPSLLEQRIQRLMERTSNSHVHLHRGGLAALLLMLTSLVLIPCATMQFARAQNPVPDTASPDSALRDSTLPNSGQAKNPAAIRNESKPFGNDPFKRPPQAQIDAANDAAFPPGIFGSEDHESTKAKVLQWISQSGSDIAAERQAVAKPLSKYFGVSDQVENAVLRLTRDKDKSVRAAASLAFFMNSQSLNRDAKTIDRVLKQVLLGMVRDDVHFDMTAPYVVEKLKTEKKEEQHGYAQLVYMMLRLGHEDILDQLIKGKEDPKIVDKDEYYRKIELFKDQLTKQTRAKHIASRKTSSKQPGSDMSDPFGPSKPDNVATIANNATRAFAEAEKPKIVAELSAAEARISSVLQDETTVSFIQTPLQQAMMKIGAKHKIPVVVNRRALEEFGLTPDIPVTIDLKNVSLRSTLTLLLRQHELEMMIRDDVLQITTVAHMRATSVSRKYRTDHLPFKGADIARSLQRVLDAQTIAGDTKPVVEYLSGNPGKPGIIWVQANEAAQREALAKLNWLLNK